MATTAKGPKYSIIVPTYNEKEILPLLVCMIIKAFNSASIPTDRFEILVVDDNSPDGTAAIYLQLQKKIFPEYNLVDRCLRKKQRGDLNSQRAIKLKKLK
eukprot:GHVT01080466.1.p2 GENE.GHVT01080466.1~~GHVT01080466.1.p2  ORF type:complete len:100 (+),score=16.53 GHVT01080466.1:1546-1845(+)